MEVQTRLVHSVINHSVQSMFFDKNVYSISMTLIKAIGIQTFTIVPLLLGRSPPRLGLLRMVCPQLNTHPLPVVPLQARRKLVTLSNWPSGRKYKQ